MPFLMPALLESLVSTVCKTNALSALIWLHKCGTLLRWSRDKKPTYCLLNVFLPRLLLYLFPLIDAVTFFVPSWTCACVRKAVGTRPLHECSVWHISDVSVRRRQTQRRLIAMYSSVCAVNGWKVCTAERQALSFTSGSFGSQLSVTA